MAVFITRSLIKPAFLFISFVFVSYGNAGSPCASLFVPSAYHLGKTGNTETQLKLPSLLPMTPPAVRPWLETISRFKDISKIKSLAEEALGKKITRKQAKAVETAHLAGLGEVGKDGVHPAGIGNYTEAHLREKARILKQAGFSKAEREELIKKGVVGDPITLILSSLGGHLGAMAGMVIMLMPVAITTASLVFLGIFGIDKIARAKRFSSFLRKIERKYSNPGDEEIYRLISGSRFFEEEDLKGALTFYVNPVLRERETKLRKLKELDDSNKSRINVGGNYLTREKALRHIESKKGVENMHRNKALAFTYISNKTGYRVMIGTIHYFQPPVRQLIDVYIPVLKEQKQRAREILETTNIHGRRLSPQEIKHRLTWIDDQILGLEMMKTEQPADKRYLQLPRVNRWFDPYPIRILQARYKGDPAKLNLDWLRDFSEHDRKMLFDDQYKSH